jgi:hypothetical protein
MKLYRKSSALIVLILLIILLAACGGDDESDKPTTGKIEGVITGTSSISMVEVFLMNAETMEDVASVKLDAQAHYEFVDLKPGDYIMGAAIPGICVVIDMPNQITVEAGKVVQKNLAMQC